MPGQRPGPVCNSRGNDTIDQGTNCRAVSPRPGPVGAFSGAVGMVKKPINFARLWAGYPDEAPYRDGNGNVPVGYENQCAIKVSAALYAAGGKLDGFTGATISVGGNRLAIRAQEMAEWLQTASVKVLQSRVTDVTGQDWQTKLKGKTGIVYFQNYWLRPGEKTPSGDHIDLWNGSRLTASGFQGAVVTVLRFGLGVASGPGFSDLGKSQKILFWEVP